MTNTHGGPNRGQGRKPQGEEAMVNVSIRLTPNQRETFKAIGGSVWLRESLNAMKNKFAAEKI